jgi:thioredoxin-related protein
MRNVTLGKIGMVTTLAMALMLCWCSVSCGELGVIPTKPTKPGVQSVEVVDGSPVTNVSMQPRIGVIPNRPIDPNAIRGETGAMKLGLINQHHLAYEEHKVLYSHEDALDLAKKENAYMFVYFHTEWCQPCKRLQDGTFNSPEVRSNLQQYVIYVVDVDREPGILQMYRQAFQTHSFKISGIPTYFIVNPYTRYCERWGCGYRTPNEFMYWLKYNK